MFGEKIFLFTCRLLVQVYEWVILLSDEQVSSDAEVTCFVKPHSLPTWYILLFNRVTVTVNVFVCFLFFCNFLPAVPTKCYTFGFSNSELKYW